MPLNFRDLKDLKRFQIIREEIIQVTDEHCDIYYKGKIRNTDTGEEEYLDSNLAEIILDILPKYKDTHIKHMFGDTLPFEDEKG